MAQSPPALPAAPVAESFPSRDSRNVTEETGVAAVDRALSILAAFTPADEHLTLTQLATRTGLYKSTVLRLAESLLRGHYLARTADGNYQVGSKPLQLAAIFQRQVRKSEHVLPILRELVQRTNESASFYVPSENGRICLYRVDAPRMIRASVREGDWRPLDNGAAGFVILAFRGDAGDELDTVRRRYWASSIGNEVDPDLAAVAAPVFETAEQLAGALSISGPRYRLEAAPRDFVPLLLDAGRRLSASLGADVRAYPTSAE